MVFTGPISTCCHECRRRKVKCDGVKPNCERCTKRGTKCTGFPEKFKIVSEHWQKRQKKASNIPERSLTHEDIQFQYATSHYHLPRPGAAMARTRGAVSKPHRPLNPATKLASTHKRSGGDSVMPLADHADVVEEKLLPMTPKPSPQSPACSPHWNRSIPIKYQTQNQNPIEYPITSSKHPVYSGSTALYPATPSTTMNDIDGHIDSDLLTHDLLNDTHSPVEQSLLPGIYDCPFLNAVRAGIYDNPPLGQRLLPELYDCPFLNAIRAGIYDNPFQIDQSFPTSGGPSLQHEAFPTPVWDEFEAADIGSPFGSQVRPGDFSKFSPGLTAEMYYVNLDRACDPSDQSPFGLFMSSFFV